MINVFLAITGKGYGSGSGLFMGTCSQGGVSSGGLCRALVWVCHSEFVADISTLVGTRFYNRLYNALAVSSAVSLAA